MGQAANSKIDTVTIVKQIRQKAQPEVKPVPTVEEVLNSVLELEAIANIDYKALGELGDDKPPKDKEYRIILVNQLLKLAAQGGNPFMYSEDTIYVFNGAFFSKCEQKQFTYFLSTVAVKTGIKETRARDYEFSKKMYEQFVFTANGVHRLTSPKANEETLINVANGTLIIRHDGNITLKPFDSKDGLTYQLPYKYDKEAKTPLFMKYLNRVLPDHESQRILSEFIGTALTPNENPLFKHEKLLLLLGSGANGKSVMAEIITALFGVNIKHFSMDDITNQNGYALAELQGNLLNFATEFDGKIHADKIKKLASGEPITARRIWGAPFTMRNYGRFAFSLNKLPHGVEFTHAFDRRFLIVPFTQTINEQERDVTISKKIIDNELSGVLNWVLDGLIRFINNGYTFSHCEAASEALELYKLDTDSVKSYLNEKGYTPDILNGNFKPLQELYNDYKAHSDGNGLKPVSNRELRKRMEATKYQFAKKAVGIVVYIKFKPVEDGEIIPI